MKFPPGQRTITITQGGVTTITAIVSADGNTVNAGTIVYTWDAANGIYKNMAARATMDPAPNGTLSGATGVPPDPVYAYGGTWL